MDKKDIVIIGSGGLAREVKWLIEECNKVQDTWNILGWISKEETGTVICELPVLGDDEWLVKYKKPISVAVSVGDGNLRKKIVEYLKKKKDIFYPNIISPSARISDSVSLGKGTMIAANTVLTVDIKVGDFVYCNLSCTVGHDSVIDDFVTINPGTNISGNVCIGKYVTIGTGSSIIPYVKVDDGATIGAGAVVIRNVAANSIVVGVPAKPLEK